MKIELLLLYAEIRYWWRKLPNSKKEFYEYMCIGILIMIGFLLWISKGY